jgi:hypothetical protein
MTWAYRSRRSQATIAGSVAVVLLAVAAWTVLRHNAPSAETRGDFPQSEKHASGTPVTPRESRSPEPETPSPEVELRNLRAAAPVKLASLKPPISGELAQHPDLYAAEFVRGLLTQDFRSQRQAHLAWVQAESAQTTEPLVVGLVPPQLRDRLAVYSVIDRTNGASAIPTEQEWRQLAATRAVDTVEIQRVTEPFAWTNAVAAGRISDPGITGREVDALVTRHTPGTPEGEAAKFSVAITLNLEGPPVRPAWGFVTAVTFNAIPIGAP